MKRKVTSKKLDKLWNGITSYGGTNRKICGLSLSLVDIDVLYDIYAAYKTRQHKSFISKNVADVLEKLKLPYSVDGTGWRVN